jgi:hypothetical protein
VLGGAYCTCGDPDCITNPGECGNVNTAVSGKDNQSESAVDAPNFDIGMGGLFILIALFMIATRSRN